MNDERVYIDVDCNLDEAPSISPIFPLSCWTSLSSVWNQTIWRDPAPDHWHSEIIMEGFDPAIVKA